MYALMSSVPAGKQFMSPSSLGPAISSCTAPENEGAVSVYRVTGIFRLAAELGKYSVRAWASPETGTSPSSIFNAKLSMGLDMSVPLERVFFSLPSMVMLTLFMEGNSVSVFTIATTMACSCSSVC